MLAGRLDCGCRHCIRRPVRNLGLVAERCNCSCRNRRLVAGLAGRVSTIGEPVVEAGVAVTRLCRGRRRHLDRTMVLVAAEVALRSLVGGRRFVDLVVEK